MILNSKAFNSKEIGSMTMIKTMAVACVAMTGLSGLSMAQEGFATPPSASAIAAPRTGLYTGVTQGNGAADNTVDDYIRRGTLIGDRQFFAGYGGADLGSGAFSFKGMGFNWFGSMTAGANPSELRMGIGSGTAWAGGLILALDKTNITTAAGDTKTVIEGDGFGAFGDFNLGSSDVYGQVAMFTGYDDLLPRADHYTNFEPNVGASVEEKNSVINVMAGWKKDATTEGTHSLNVELIYNLSNHEVDPSTPAEKSSLNELGVVFGHGYILKASSDYSVFLGSNTFLNWMSESVEGVNDDASDIIFGISPNLAFQKQLGKGFEGFSGGSVLLSYETASNTTAGTPPAAAEDASFLLTSQADVEVGLRWVKDNLAVEGGLKEAFLANGPNLIGGNAGQGLFFNLGMSLGF